MKFEKIIKKYTLKSFLTRAYEESVTRAYRNQYARAIVRPFFKIPQTDKWVFIIGCYNSGTTLLQNLISSHPEIDHMPREGVRFTSILPQPEDLGWTRMWIKCPEHMNMTAAPNQQTYKKIQSDWAPMWSNKRLTTRLEKSITNVTRMEWLNKCFRNSYFIGIWRNGYCVSEGIRRRAKPAKATNYPDDCYPIELAAKQWLAANNLLIQDSSKVDRYFGLSYEQLIEAPEDSLGNIFSFLELQTPNMRTENGKLFIEENRFSLKNQNKDSIARLSSDDVVRINEVISSVQRSLEYQIINVD